MKLHLPHRLQAALMAAIASVSFSTVSSATLAAGAFAFFAGQGNAAEDPTTDSELIHQQEHAKKIEFGKLSISETGAEQVESTVAMSCFGSGDVTSVDVPGSQGADVVAAALAEENSAAAGEVQIVLPAVESADTNEFVNAAELAAMESAEPVFTVAPAAPAAATSALDLAPQQDNSYSGTTVSAASGSTVSAPSVGGGAGAVSVGGATGSTRSIARPVVMKTAAVTQQDNPAGDTATLGSVSVNMQGSADEEDALTRQEEVIAQPRLAAAMADASEGGTRNIAATASSNLGNIMFSGDSITHGVGSPSYRYFMFKILTDNGIGNNAVGPLKGNWSDDVYTGTQYGGETFTNIHAAEYGSRSYEIANTTLRSNPGSYGFKWTSGNVGATYANTYINNWLGLDTLKKDGATRYTGDTYNVDTFMMLIGTNDMLTDIGSNFKTAEKLNNALGAMLGASYTDNGDGTHSFSFSTAEQEASSEASLVKIWRSVKQANPNANVVFMGVPALGVGHGAANKEVLDTVNLYNEALKTWCDNHGVTYVQSDTGLRDVTSAAGVGVRSMYQGDQCHLSYQGDLIFGGNIAKAMGYAGRTVGLTRSDAAQAPEAWTQAAETSYILSSGTQTVATDVFSVLNGYTVDFGAVFGDGAENNWAAQANALTITIGDGTRTGSLSLSEGYVLWNNSTILYSKDNHLQSDNLRVAYVNKGVNDSDGVTSGYYVWLGDVLIGEGLTAGSGSLNGITLSANGGTGTVSNLSWADTAYAPTSSLYTNGAAGFHLTQFAPRESYDSDVKHLADVNFAGIDPVSSGQYATNGKAATGNIAVVRTGDRESDQKWVGAVGAAHEGNVDIDFKNFNTSSAVILAVVSNSVTDGNVSVVLDGGTNINVKGNFSNSGAHSFHGVYRADVGGNLQLEVNDATLQGGILMGHADGTGTISGDTKLIINKGASIGGSIYGGSSSAGTISGNTDIAITGGTVNGSIYGGNRANGSVVSQIGRSTNILVTGGCITGNIVGGNEAGSAGTIGGTTNVTVEGVIASIGGTITAQNVTLRGIADSGFEDGFDKYSNAITATEKLTLDAYTASHVGSPITTQRVLATNNTNTTISNLTLTACDITAEAGSSLTLEGTLTLGNTATYSGNISVADGITFSMSNEVAASLASAGYSSGASGYRTLGTASLLTSSDGSRLTVGNTGSYLGTGALEGATFNYDSDTGTLSATSARVLGSTYYVNSEVTYARGTEAYTATDFVVNNGGNLTLGNNLKDGTTITGAAGSTTSKITIADSVTLAKSSVSGTIATIAVEDGGVYNYGDHTDGSSPVDLLGSLSGEGTVKVHFTPSGHGGSYVKTDANFSGTLDLSGTVHLQNLNNNTANDDVDYYIHDANIWYGGVNIDVLRDVKLGGVVEYRPEGDTTFSGILTDDGSANFNWQLGGGATNNAQKGKTIKLTNAGASSLSKVTLVNDNLKLEGVQGTGNDRVLFTGNVVVNSGRVLTLWPGSDNCNTKNDAAEVRGTITLNGTDSSVAKIVLEDGSVHITEAVDLGDGGVGEIDNTWGKNQYVQAFKGLNATLTIDRKTGDDGKGGYINVMENGAFSGTVKLISRAGDESGGIILHDSGAALANTVVDFTGASDSEKSLLAFISGNGTFDNNKKLTTTTFTDGAVAGLKGDKGCVKANILTINLSDSYTYGGDLAVSKLVLTGTGTQTVSTKGLTIDGQRIVNAQGTGEAGSTAAFAKIFSGTALEVADGAKLVLDGNVGFNSNQAPTSMGVKELEITGFLNMNSSTSGATWDVGSNSLSVGNYLWLTNQQNMTIGQGGSLSVGGALRLSHPENDEAGRYKVTVEADGASFSAAGVELSGGGNKLLLNNSDVTFTRTAENASSNLLSNANNTVSAGNSNTTISLSGNTLHSGDNGWNLTAIDGVTLTVDGATKLDIADGKNITIGGANIDGSFTHNSGSTGTLALAGDTINGATLAGGKFALSGATTFNGTLVLNDSTLTIDSAATAQISTGTDMRRFELKGTGESGATAATYSDGLSGYLQGDSATYYLIKKNGTSSVSGAFATVTGENVAYNAADYTFTVSGTDNTTYYVNENLAYDADKMNGATYLNIAEGMTLTTTANPADAKTLLGSGTYSTSAEGSSSKISVGTADNWTGIVELNGVNLWNSGHTNLNTLGNAKSWVKLTGVTSIDNNWNNGNTINSNLLLEDKNATTPAWKITNGSSGNGTQFVYTLTGQIKGNGTIEKAAAWRQSFAFTGDISGWTGALTFSGSANNSAHTATFSGDATTINAAITRTYTGGQNLNLTLTSPSIKSEAFTINNTVVVNTLTATNQNVVLGSNTKEDGTVTHGSLSLTAASQVGTLTINDGNTVTATSGGQTAAIRGDIFINGGGKLTLTADNAMGWGSSGMGKLTLEGSSAEKLAVVQMNANNTLSHGIEMKGNAQINGDGNGNGLIQVDSNAVAGTGGLITVSGTNNTIGTKLGQRAQMTLNIVGGESTLDVTGAIEGPTWDDAHLGLIKLGEGTVTFNNDSNRFYGYTQQAGSTVIGSAANFEAKNANESKPLAISGGDFTVNANNKTVTLNTNVTLADSTFTLTAGTVTLGNTRSFTATDGTININGGTFNTGTTGVTLDAASALNMTGGTLNVGAAEGALSINGTATVTGGVINATTDGALTIGNGAVLNLAATSGSAAGSTSFLRGSVTVQNGGQLVLTGHDATGYNGGDSALQKITVQAGGQLLLGFDNSNETYVGTLILDGTLDMQQGHSGSRVDLFSRNGHNAKIQVSDNAHGVVAEGVALNLRQNDSEFEIGAGGTLTVNGTITQGDEGNKMLRKTGEGEMIINTSLNGTTGIPGIKMEAGTLTLNGESNKMGALNISANAALKTFGGEINGLTMDGSGSSITNNGTLSIGGAAVLTNMTATGDAVSGYSDGVNGFITSTNAYQLVTNEGAGTVASTVTSWSINGSTVTSATLAADGVLTTMDKATDGIYHVNETMNYSSSTATTDMGAATLFSVEEGIELQVAGNLLNGRNVTLANGATLKAGDATYDFTNNQIGTLTLTGETANINTGLHNIALRGASGSTLTLNGHKLNVNGGNRLGLFNTTVDAGTISVTNDGGVIASVQVGYGSSANSTVNAENTTFEFAGGQLVMGGGSTATFKGLTMATDSTVGVIIGDSIGDSNATGGNIKLALGGETYTYCGSIANYINLTTTGAGTQNFALSGTANIGKVTAEAGSMSFSGTTATVASGVELAAGTSVTFGAGASITGATLAGTSSLNFTGGTSTLAGNITGSGNIVKNGAAAADKVTLTGSTEGFTGAVLVNAGTFVIENNGTTKTHAVSSVVLGQDAKLQSFFRSWSSDYPSYKTALGTVSLGDGVSQATVEATVEATNYGGLTSIGRLAGKGTLTLQNSGSSDLHTTFSIGGSATESSDTAFHGALKVTQTNGGDKRGTVVVFNDEYTAADAVLGMNAVQTANNRILGIGINSSTVKLKGINDDSIGTAGANSLYQIFSGSGDSLPAQYDGGTTYFDNAADGTDRTLELTGDGEYTTAAKLGAHINLAMTGAGTQTFSGDMTAFNGHVTVNDGTLVFSHAGGTQASAELHLTGIAGAGGKLESANAVEVNIAASEKYTYRGELDLAFLNKTGEGEQEFTSVVGIDYTKHRMQVSEGTLTLSGGSVFDGTISNQGGLVQLGGVVNITMSPFGGFSLLADASPGGYSEGANGFLGATTRYWLVDNDGDEARAEALENVVWQVDGVTHDDAVFENGILTIPGSDDPTVYYVNEGMVTYSQTEGDISKAKNVLLNGGTLVLDGNLNEGTTISVAADKEGSALQVSNSTLGNTDFLSVGGDYSLTGNVNVNINSLNNLHSTGSGLLTHTQGGSLTLTAPGIGYYDVAMHSTGATGTLVSNLGNMNVLRLSGNLDMSSFEKVSVGDGKAMLFAMRGAGHTVSMGTLDVSGRVELGTFATKDSYQGTYNVKNLQGSGNLLLTGGSAQGTKHNVFNLGGGEAENSFSGTISVQPSNPNNYSGTAASLVLQDETVAKDAVISLQTGPNRTAALGVAADTAKVGGITDSDNGGAAYIFGGADDATHNVANSFQSQKTGNAAAHTLVLTNTADQKLTTGATVMGDLNLVMDGAGSQAFKGDVSNFDGTITVKNGNLSFYGDSALSSTATTVEGGVLRVANTGVVDLGDLTLSGGQMDLATAVNVGSLNTTGGTLTFAGVEKLSSSGAITIGSGTVIDLANITYRADTRTQRIVLATSESGSITLGDSSAYTFTGSKYDTATYSLEKDGNDLVLVVKVDVGDWPPDTKVRYTYTDAHGQQQTQYDIKTETTSAHGYEFNKGDGGVVAFNPDLFTDKTNHTYTDKSGIIYLNSDTTFIVEEGDTVKFTGMLQGNDKSGTGHSGTLVKQGAGTLEMAINSTTIGPPSKLQNAYEGSVDVLDGTLHVVDQLEGVTGDGSSLASANGAHVRVAKDATLLLDAGVDVSIPRGHRNYDVPGDEVSMEIDADGQQATITNAYISQEGIRPDDAADGGRASLKGIGMTLKDGSATGTPLSISMADIVATEFMVQGYVEVDNSHIEVGSQLLFYKWGEDVPSEVKIKNNSRVEFTGEMALVKDSDVDKTSKIQNLGNKSQVMAALIGHNRVEVACVEQGGVATREINEEQLTITYNSDQYKGFALGSDWIRMPLSLAITLSDMDMPEDLTGYTFKLIMEDLDSSALLTGEWQSLKDSDLNVSLYMPQYTGSQWEEMVASVQAMYDTNTGNTVFMFSNVVVPEPTTGTLSLLALAALCARRRRQK